MKPHNHKGAHPLSYWNKQNLRRTDHIKTAVIPADKWSPKIYEAYNPPGRLIGCLLQSLDPDAARQLTTQLKTENLIKRLFKIRFR